MRELGGQRDKHRRGWLCEGASCVGVEEQSERAGPIFLKCCCEAEDEGVQVTTVAMLVSGLASVVDNLFAGSGKQMTVQTEDVAALMPRLPSKKRFQRVDSGTKLMCSIGAIRQKRGRTITSFVKARRGGSSFAGFADSSCRNVMAEVVANSVAWSRRVFAVSDVRRICNSADEFNRESSRMILIYRDLCSNVFWISSVAGDATQSRKTSDGIFCSVPFF